MFSTPYPYIDLNKVEKNIQSMQQNLDNANIEHWPHVKTHKSSELARKQLAYGASGITCAKLSEAEVMANAGIQHMLVAYPIVGDDKLDRLKRLAKSVHIRTVVDSKTVARGISAVGESLGEPIEVLIDVDGGTHRGGVQSGSETLEFANEIFNFPGINIVGVFTYVGHIYELSSDAEIQKETQEEAKNLLDNQQLLNSHGFELTVTSAGSTLSSYYAKSLQGVTQSRAGNYIFGDLNAVNVGVYDLDDCALRVMSTIVSIPFSGYAIIDAGSKTLTTDLAHKGNNYGYVLNHPGVDIVKLNEEHGYLQYDSTAYDFNVGDVIEIIPNHSCVVPNLNDYIYTFRNNQYEGLLEVSARGKNF